MINQLFKVLGPVSVVLWILIGGLPQIIDAQVDPVEGDRFVYLPLVQLEDDPTNPEGEEATSTPIPNTSTPTPAPSQTPTVAATSPATPSPTVTPSPSSTPVSTDGFPNGATILTLGDSRVEGNSPAYESYRYELWKNLIDQGWTFDLVGTRVDESEYADYQDQSFDRDHEGTGGATTADILEVVNETITSANSPDIALIGIGGNDYLDGGVTVDEALDNVNGIIDHLQATNPNIIIFVEQIAPAISFFMNPIATEQFDQYNASILILAEEQTDGSSVVIPVDMATGWQDSYFADPVHYNTAGANVVADRYAQAMIIYFEGSP